MLQEIGQAADTPDDIVFDHLQSVSYPDQPMGWPILGLVETVSAFTQEHLRTYMGANYRAGDMTFVASGAVSHDAIVRLVAEKFAGLKPGPAPALLAARYVGGDLRFEEDLEQAHIAYALPGVSSADPDFLHRPGLCHRARRRDVLAPVPGSAREARPVLCDLRLRASLE